MPARRRRSVAVELHDHGTVVISATRYLPAEHTVGALLAKGVLQVICTRGGGQPVVMREFSDWGR